MYIAIDIGGTKTNFLSFNTISADSFIEKTSLSSVEIKDYSTALNIIKEKCHEIAKGEHIDAIGIAVTGDIDSKSGKVLDSLFLNSWNGKELVSDLNRMMNVSIFIENDAVCAGLAELSNITQGKQKNYTFIAIGTGVGGVKLTKYSNSIMVFPWDFGHMILDLNGPKCLCGQHGCLEVYSSGSGIKNRYGKPLEEIQEPAVWQDLVSYMAQAIVSYLAVNPTEKFIFGGGITFKTAGLVDQIESKVRELSVYSGNFPQFEVARYSEEAQAFGLLQLMSSQITLVNMNYY